MAIERSMIFLALLVFVLMGQTSALPKDDSILPMSNQEGQSGTNGTSPARQHHRLALPAVNECFSQKGITTCVEQISGGGPGPLNLTVKITCDIQSACVEPGQNGQSEYREVFICIEIGGKMQCNKAQAEFLQPTVKPPPQGPTPNPMPQTTPNLLPQVTPNLVPQVTPNLMPQVTPNLSQPNVQTGGKPPHSKDNVAIQMATNLLQNWLNQLQNAAGK